MTLYHVTTTERAAAIQRAGFIDCSCELFGGRWLRGVQLCDERLWELHRDDPVAFEIDLSLDSVATYQCTTPEHGYRRWIVPSSVLNRANRRLLNSEGAMVP